MPLPDAMVAVGSELQMQIAKNKGIESFEVSLISRKPLKSATVAVHVKTATSSISSTTLQLIVTHMLTL